MNIIIVGCGKVGSDLVAQLSKEDNDICVIDTDKEVVANLTEAYDVMGYCGNGTDYTVLVEAGIANADLLIAVTGSDELNLLCCVMAQRASRCELIARVRNPMYERESEFLRKELGLSMIINPELLAAQEIFQLLCFPNAADISFFAQGQAEVVRYKIPKESMLDGMTLKDVSDKIEGQILVCAIEKENEVVIPKGNTILHSGDTISIISSRKTITAFFKMIKAKTNPVKNTMIIGGGKISVYLARMLIKVGIKVKIFEKNPVRCDELCDMLPEASVICGDGSDRELLKEERIDKMDSFVALTNIDEENIILSLFARNKVDKKVVTKINRFQLNEVVYNLDLDSVVYPKNISTEIIIQYVRSKNNSYGDNNIQTLYRLHEGKVEAMEFVISRESALTEKPIYMLNLKSDILIGCITRQAKSFIPKGSDQIMVGDSIIIVTKRIGINDALDIMEV